MRKKRWWRLHSWLGLIAGIPLLIIALSGSILVFKQELDLWLEPELQTIPDPGLARKSLDQLVAAAHAQLPNHVINGVGLRHQADGSDLLYLVEKGNNEWLKAYIDGTTGQLLNQPRSLSTGFTDWMLMLHYTFLGGHVGMLIVGLLALLLCGLGLSGFMIYRRFWINLFTLQWRKSLRILAGDFHRKLGVISSPVFLILGITGAYWNITHSVNDLFIHGLDEEHGLQQQTFLEPSVSLDALLATCQQKVPDYQASYLAFPTTEDSPLIFYGQVAGFGSMRSAYGIFFSFDRKTGESIGLYDVRSAPVVHQVVDAFVPLHYGTFGGLLTRLIWCVLGMAPGLLSLSGFYVYWQRSKKAKARGTKKPKF